MGVWVREPDLFGFGVSGLTWTGLTACPPNLTELPLRTNGAVHCPLHPPSPTTLKLNFPAVDPQQTFVDHLPPQLKQLFIYSLAERDLLERLPKTLVVLHILSVSSLPPTDLTAPPRTPSHPPTRQPPVLRACCELDAIVYDPSTSSIDLARAAHSCSSRESLAIELDPPALFPTYCTRCANDVPCICVGGFASLHWLPSWTFLPRLWPLSTRTWISPLSTPSLAIYTFSIQEACWPSSVKRFLDKLPPTQRLPSRQSF